MPAVENTALFTEYVELIAPTIGAPLKYHWYETLRLSAMTTARLSRDPTCKT